MTTLIITVGTRQVGWRCKDGIVRCLGADGDRGNPNHINDLYRELEIDRGYHEENNQAPWSVSHLGEQLWEWCEVHEDFSSVELLMDGHILVQEIDAAISHVILWGTDQPTTVSWNYRRLDTVWLAKLMEGKIRQTWPNVAVDVWAPKIAADAKNLKIIRQGIEGFLLEYIQESARENAIENLELLIATKGSAPIIANTLDICAAALARQYPVLQVSPIEPDPQYDPPEAGSGVRLSQKYIKTPIGESFWPLERERIVSAWERGDFSEARVWLEAHRDRYKVIYQLANKLALVTNGELIKAVTEMRGGWINSKLIAAKVTPLLLLQWCQLLALLLENNIDAQFQQVWEQLLIVELMMKRGNYTNGFMLFAQLLERILYIRYKQENWIKSKHIVPPLTYKGSPEEFNPALGGLIIGWCSVHRFSDNSPKAELLDRIRLTRNDLVHNGVPVDLKKLADVWKPSSSNPKYLELMQQTLELVAGGRKQPEVMLLRSLYEWGLEILKK